MRVLPALATGAFLAVVIPIGSASAAMPNPAAAVSAASRPGLIQADWNGGPGWHGDWHDGWHHHWRHEWRDHWHPYWHPDWHPYWHHHWHHGWERPYGGAY